MKVNREQLDAMKKIYAEFGIDFHDIPPTLSSKINNLVRTIIKLRMAIIR